AALGLKFTDTRRGAQHSGSATGKHHNAVAVDFRANPEGDASQAIGFGARSRRGAEAGPDQRCVGSEIH
ncbi:MAG: hypothetical protein PVI56_11905, partial [Gammaproteobacteria bacterium]